MTGKVSKPKYKRGKKSAGSAYDLDGPGIYVTCPKGKESAAVNEIYDLLDQAKLALYPDITPNLEESEDGKIKSSTKGGEGDDLEVEDLIAQELAELRDGSRRGQADQHEDGHRNKRAKLDIKSNKAFRSVLTSTDCVCFISVSSPYDPMKLSEHLIREACVRDSIRSRFVQRLYPISATCSAIDIPKITAISQRVILDAFKKWEQEHPDETGATYRIETFIRNHTAPLSRSVIMGIFSGIVPNVIATSVSKENEAEASSSSTNPIDGSESVAPEEIFLRHPPRVDLQSPSIIIITLAFRNTYGIGICDGKLFLGEGKKYNIREIGLKKIEETEKKGSDGGETRPG